MTTIIKLSRMAAAQKKWFIEATFPEVLATATFENTVPVPMTRGKLKDFHIVCSSTDFNVSIRQKVTITPPSVDEIFNYSNVNLQHSFSNFALSFFNMDTDQTENLYIEIDNTAGIDTGVISIKLVLEEG